MFEATGLRGCWLWGFLGLTVEECDCCAAGAGSLRGKSAGSAIELLWLRWLLWDERALSGASSAIGGDDTACLPLPMAWGEKGDGEKGAEMPAVVVRTTGEAEEDDCATATLL